MEMAFMAYVFLSMIAFMWLSWKWTATEVYKLIWIVMWIYGIILLGYMQHDWMQSQIHKETQKVILSQTNIVDKIDNP